jgi:hypothetical protein
MTKTDASTKPTVDGLYVVWIDGSPIRLVLAWRCECPGWRHGATRVDAHVTHYLGPLPE